MTTKGNFDDHSVSPTAFEAAIVWAPDGVEHEPVIWRTDNQGDMMSAETELNSGYFDYEFAEPFKQIGTISFGVSLPDDWDDNTPGGSGVNTVNMLDVVIVGA